MIYELLAGLLLRRQLQPDRLAAQLVFAVALNGKVPLPRRQPLPFGQGSTKPAESGHNMLRSLL